MNHIFDEAMLGNDKLKNRIIRSATWMATADERGYVTQTVVDTYHELAKGNVGGIITGMVSVSPLDHWIEGQLNFHDDSYIEGHRKITSKAHEYGSCIYIQAGINASVQKDKQGMVVPKEIDDLSDDKIKDIIRLFGDGALRAEKSGYDGIQIHCAHFWFLSRFLSPIFNHRYDEYGGSAANRVRFVVDIIKEIRSRTGEEFTIITKINCTDAYDGGVTTKDFLESCSVLSDAGIDGIEVSANGTSVPAIKAGYNEAYFEEAATLLKEKVDVPVILVGGHRSIDNMELVLNRSNVEFLSMSRPLIREPDLLVRWKNGDNSPAKCVSCNSCYNTPGHECIFNI